MYIYETNIKNICSSPSNIGIFDSRYDSDYEASSEFSDESSIYEHVLEEKRFVDSCRPICKYVGEYFIENDCFNQQSSIVFYNSSFKQDMVEFPIKPKGFERIKSQVFYNSSSKSEVKLLMESEAPKQIKHLAPLQSLVKQFDIESQALEGTRIRMEPMIIYNSNFKANVIAKSKSFRNVISAEFYSTNFKQIEFEYLAPCLHNLKISDTNKRSVEF